jgi:cytochrome c-type biogenesis protein CcmH
MILLLLFATLLAALTVWFLSRSLRAPASVRNEDGDALVQLRDRLLAQLREVDVETGDRNMDATVAVEERARLEAELAQVLKKLEALPPTAGSTPAPSSARLALPVVIALVVILPLASAGLYFAKNAVTLAQLDQVQSIPSGEVPPMVLEMVARLERRLAEQPEDPRGWAQLGRAYAVLQREGDARAAYVRAYQLAPKDKEILGAYAGFLMSLDPSQPSAEAVMLFKRLHALDSSHPGALWALGLVAYQEQKFGQAVKYWEQLLQLLPPDSEVTPQVQQAVDMARDQKGKAR